MTEPDIHALSDSYLEDYCRLDPIAATFLGVAGHDHAWPDLSPDGFAARERLDRATCQRAEAMTPVAERDRVAREALVERLGLAVERVDAGVARRQFNVLTSPLHDVRQVFDLMPTETEADWVAIATRLASVPDVLDGLRRTLAEEAAAGRVVAARQYAEVADQVTGWTSSETGPDVFTALVSGAAGIPDSLTAELGAAAARARDAFGSFGTFLSAEMVPLGREKEAVGREEYELASREFLGATVDLEQTYAWGWDELARLTEDMSATAARILPGAGIAEAVAHLDADPDRQIQGKEAFRDWMQELADRTVAELADVHFDIPEPIRRIECCLAPTSDGGIYYTGPSEDFSRPGRMWWSVPEGITSFTPWREVTTVFHEGVPGHHLQVGQTVYRSEALNRWQRLMCWVSGHGEGWALYAERLMDELGYLADPADRLGMLDAQTLRAARVIVDIGMHLELPIPANPWNFHVGETWTPELGLEFMRAHARMEDAFIRFEVKRYLGWPGQAPSYKVGERIWLEARESAKARHGADFDLKAFHSAALDLGSIGLDPLRAALARL
ncbi:DUF885 domain-containing protein [Nocardioides limicola]|uniref:DUF885 domain-containing protein n=1 Tax=Nocardioides limicola TaxID=2803368 RepID=UPI00193C3222|nr:DUF885 domain-containing protein [Nocardioides sp. DJM-14]